MQWYTAYTRIIKSPVDSRRDPRTNASMESNLTLASIFPSMLVDMLINTADKCRFIRYAIDVNWSNTSQISKGNFVNYKDSYIILTDANATFVMMSYSNYTRISLPYSKLSQQIAISPILNKTLITLMMSTLKNSIII